MKILKPDKVEMRKFVCPDCGCEFIAVKLLDVRDGDCVACPQDECYHMLRWEDGEPYEEPTQDYKATICKLSDMLYDRFTMDEDTATEVAAMLVANGVTFREE